MTRAPSGCQRLQLATWHARDVRDNMTSTEVTSGCLLTMLCFCGVCVPLDGKILLAMNFNTKLTKEFIIVLAPILPPPILSRSVHIIIFMHPTFPFLCSAAAACRLPPSFRRPIPNNTPSYFQLYSEIPSPVYNPIKSHIIVSTKWSSLRPSPFALGEYHWLEDAPPHCSSSC